MSGRRNKTKHAADIDNALLTAAHKMDLRQMRWALCHGARVHAQDDTKARPLGVFVNAWLDAANPPDPAPFVSLLADAGADLARPTGERYGPHTLESLRGTDDDVPLVEALFDEGMKVGWDHLDHAKLLTRVIGQGAAELLRWLVSPYNVDAQDPDGETALFAVLRSQRPDEGGMPDGNSAKLLDILFAAGIDESIQDIFSHTALEGFTAAGPAYVAAYEKAKAAHVHSARSWGFGFFLPIAATDRGRIECSPP
jgi:hypothetical protein